MTVKELFRQASVENAELQAEIESLITTVESKKTDGIPYARFKEKVDESNELKADLAEKEAENEKLKAEISEIKEEIERLKISETKFDDYKKSERVKQLDILKERLKKFDIDEADPFYEKINKIKHKFGFEGEIEDLDIDKIQSLNNLFETYDEIGYFEKEDKDYPDGKKSDGKSKEEDINPFLPDTSNLEMQIKLKKEDPAKYNRLKELAEKEKMKK